MRAPTIAQLRRLAKLVWTEVEVGRDGCSCQHPRRRGHLYMKGVNRKGYTELISIWLEDEESEREAIAAALLRLSEMRPDGEQHGIDKPGWLTRQMNRLDAQSVAWPAHMRRAVEEKG